jgi:hypothetical protein
LIAPDYATAQPTLPHAQTFGNSQELPMRRRLTIAEIHGRLWEIDPPAGDNYLSDAALVFQDSH